MEKYYILSEPLSLSLYLCLFVSFFIEFLQMV